MKLEPGQPKTMGLAAFFAGAVTLVPTLWLILSGHNAGRAAFDSVVYHERFIRDLAASWPRFDVSNPLTATTPGYHVLLATFVKLGFDSELALRLISALIGASLGGLLAAWLAKRVLEAGDSGIGGAAWAGDGQADPYLGGRPCVADGVAQRETDGAVGVR